MCGCVETAYIVVDVIVFVVNIHGWVGLIHIYSGGGFGFFWVIFSGGFGLLLASRGRGFVCFWAILPGGLAVC